MVSMLHFLRRSPSPLVVAVLVMGPIASNAWAVKQFQDQFYALYLDRDSADVDDKAYVAAVREAKCNLCHAGNSKKDRNTYGIELAKLLDNNADKGNAEKIRRALQQVSALTSDRNKPTSMTFGELIAARQLPAAETKTVVSPMNAIARSDEPIRDEFSLDAAVAFLDNAAQTWQNDRKCFACHSDYTFLETRPLVSWKTPVHDQLRAKLEQLAANPGKVSFRVTEGVMAACVLAQNDALTTGKLHPVTRQALDYMWTLQSEDGGFDWLKSDQPPSEVDDHFGATMAVIGVGMAPDGYAETPAALAGLAKLREYLKNNPPVNLHQRSHVAAGLAARRRDHDSNRTSRSDRRPICCRRNSNGGWGIVSLGNWQRHDGKPDDTEVQRRLRHRIQHLRAASGGRAGRRSADTSRDRLVEIQPADQRPLVHTQPMGRQPALPESTWNLLCDSCTCGMRREVGLLSKSCP